MLKRFRSLLPLHSLAVLEVALIGLFFVQSTRFLVSEFYSRVSSATLYSIYPEGAVPLDTLGLVLPTTISSEIAILGFVLAIPLLIILVGGFQVFTTLAILGIALTRLFITLPSSPLSPIISAQIVVGLTLAYIALIIRHRPQLLPYFFVIGLGLDQIFRAFGNTQDPSLQVNFANTQWAISIAVVAVHLVSRLASPSSKSRETLPFTSAIGLGALLFLQLSLFSLPNALASRTDSDYAFFAPITLLATLLPIVPWVRRQAKQLIAPFDSTTRGWIWLILLFLFIIFGLRIGKVIIANLEIQIGAVALVIAQLLLSLLWWWFARPLAAKKRDLTPLWIPLAAIIFMVFVALDSLTYDYAFIQSFMSPLDSLNTLLLPILRGFRGLGLGIILIAAFFSVLPMILSTKSIAWTSGTSRQTLLSLLLVTGLTTLVGTLSRPIAVFPVLNPQEIRIGTYNINAGYSEFYHYNLEGIAEAIQQSGVDVILLQEVEAGRLTSFGVDQSLWLARRLGMDRRFFPTNEGLLGLAVLSKIPIVFDDGMLLPSIDQQTGIQRVQIQPDAGTIILYNTALGLLLAGDTTQAQEANQQAQLNAILTLIARHVQTDYNGQLGRMILGGTFNNIPDSPLIQSLKTTGFTDPFEGAPRFEVNTYHRIDQQARTDYLWIWRESIRPIGRLVLQDNQSSDHRLAFIGVELR